jgi:antitoxin HigA-1
VLYDHTDPDSYESVFKGLYLRESAPPHPGEILRDDIFPALAISKAALARQLGISARKLGSLLAERTPVTVDLALRLGTVLGYGPRYWLGLQMHHDIWLTEQPNTLKLKPLTWRRR